MLFFTTKFTRRKKVAAGVILAGLVVCLVVYFWPGRTGADYDGDAAMDAMNAVFSGQVKNGEEGALFLTSLGWEVSDEPDAEAEVIIPKEFDQVYEHYNNMQKETGYDLSKQKGETVTLYTYTVTNHPTGEDTHANLLVADGRVVGGDICSVRLDGFMHGLIKNDQAADAAG